MVRIRLKRMGATKRPFYRVVVADQRSPRDGRFIENIGKYHPLDDPSIIEIDADRALYWLSKGAQPSSQVQNLLKIQGIWDRFKGGDGGGATAPATGGSDSAGPQAAVVSEAGPAPEAETAPEAEPASSTEAPSEAGSEPNEPTDSSDSSNA